MDVSQLFNSGNYAAIALGDRIDSWEYYAAHGLIGNAKKALDGLARFPNPEARFYAAAACWIDGDEREASAFLRGLDFPRAERLRALIAKPQIQVLAQMPSQPEAPSGLLQGAGDGRFVIKNLGLKGNDIRLEPYADIHPLIPAGFTPDFFICREIEWMALARNLHELACPIFGHTADFDVHCQAVYPWYRMFDEIVTCGPYEWQSLQEMQTVPVSTFPKAYGLPTLPARTPRHRDIDLFLSGTMVHPYHPDKAKFVFDLLGIEDETLNLKVVPGHLPLAEYWELVARSKISVPYVRFDGSMPTRGLEALAMGTGLALQKGSVLGAYVGENEGVLTYGREPGALRRTIVKMAREWPTIEARAARGADYIRNEFSLARTSGQYLRYLTFLASKSRPLRPAPPEPMTQKRTIFHQGWFHSCDFYARMLQLSVARHRHLPPGREQPHFRLDIARDMLLFHAQAALPAVAERLLQMGEQPLQAPHLLERALTLYAAGVEKHPRSLVMRFNLLRAAVHFGSAAAKTKALELGRQITLQPASHWESDVFEDVFPWDFFGEFFNYRDYFDLVIESLRRGETRNPRLHSLILASVNHYLSLHLGNLECARRAVELDPGFALYQLRLGSLLATREETRSEGVDRLLELAATSIVRLQAWEELQSLVRRGGLEENRLAVHAAAIRRIQSRISADPAKLTALPEPPSSYYHLMNTTPGNLPQNPSSPPMVGEAAPRRAITAEPGKAPPGPGAPAGAGRKPRILLVPLEFMSWQRAKSWSYTGALGIEEGLIANGADCFVLPAWFEVPADSPDSLLKYARELCRGREFDQVWVWLTHNQYGDEFLGWLASLAPVRVGLTMESMEHTTAELAQFPHLRGRREFVASQLRHMTHVLAADEVDAESFAASLPVQAQWYPIMVPERCVRDCRRSAADFATFSGALYGTEREALLTHAPLRGLLAMPALPEHGTTAPLLFDSLHRLILAEVRKTRDCNAALLEGYVDGLRKIRRLLFDLWMDGFGLGFASVNLPSVFKSYAGRVAESMAAGTPVVSWNTPGRPRNRALFTPGKEILLFDRHNPGELADHLRRLKADPEFARELAENARRKILSDHTAEIGTRRILQWIAAGAEPRRETAGAGAHSAPPPAVPADYCLKRGYQSRPQPIYFQDTCTAETGITWQPDVYSFGADIARRLGCTRIIDVGCGWAQKLSHLQGEFETVGIDFGSNLDYCRAHYDRGQWREADFEQDGLLPVSPAESAAAVVICSDVIEHMIKPEALLRKVRELLRGGAVAVISTPERDLTWGPDNFGPPPNQCHTREWNLAEFADLLKHAGLTVEYAGVTRSHDRDPARKTILAIVGNPAGDYRARFAARSAGAAGPTFGEWLAQLNQDPAISVRAGAADRSPAAPPSDPEIARPATISFEPTTLAPDPAARSPKPAPISFGPATPSGDLAEFHQAIQNGRKLVQQRRFPEAQIQLERARDLAPTAEGAARAEGILALLRSVSTKAVAA